MAKPSHYAVLGVGRDESSEGIRAAYRRLARQTHPDCTGSDRADDFLDIAEAYRVLSDPDERARYDAAFARVPEWTTPCGQGSPAAEPLIAEPLRPDRPEHGFCRPEPMAEPLTRRPSYEGLEWHDGREMQADVVLTPEQAATGVVVRLQGPVVRPCPRCGDGRLLSWRCVGCGGRGVRVVIETQRIHIPAGVRGGEVVRVPLGEGRGGIASLRVRIARAGR